MKRNTKSQPCVSAVSMQPTRTIMLRYMSIVCVQSPLMFSYVGRLRAALFDGSKFDTGVCQVPLTLDEVCNAIKLTIVTYYSLRNTTY